MKTNSEVEEIGKGLADQYTRSLWEMHNLALEQAAMAAERVPVSDRNPALVRNEIIDRIRALAVELPPAPNESVAGSDKEQTTLGPDGPVRSRGNTP